MLGLVLSADSLVNADPNEGDVGAAIVGAVLGAVGLGLSGLVVVSGLGPAARRTARLERTLGGPLPGGEERAAARVDARLQEAHLRGITRKTERLLEKHDPKPYGVLDSVGRAQLSDLLADARQTYLRLVALGENDQADRLLDAMEPLQATRFGRL
jgi:hypothetical protein